MDFRKLIRPATQKIMRRESAEVARLHALDDAALAREVLALSRRAIEIRNDKVELPHLTYTTALTHQVIPFLARKLDPSIALTPIEEASIASTRSDSVNNMTGLEGDPLRDYVGRMIDNAMITYGLTREQGKEPAIRLLERILEHGNPVALLVDRLAPAPAGLAKVDRPGNGPARYPAWQPGPERPPLQGSWLMVTHPAGHEEVVDYLDSRADAEAALAKVAREGLAESHRLIRWSDSNMREPAPMVMFDLRDWQDEVTSEVIEAPLWRAEPEVECDVLEP